MDNDSYVTERKILDGISFAVTAGQSVAIVGTSGSGINCILCFFSYAFFCCLCYLL